VTFQYVRLDFFRALSKAPLFGGGEGGEDAPTLWHYLAQNVRENGWGPSQVSLPG